MKNYATACAVILGLAGCANTPMKPQEIASLPDTELCVSFAMATLYGPSATYEGKRIPLKDVQFEMAHRAQPCEPREQYFQLAQLRMEQAQQKQQAMTQALQGYANYLQRQQAIEQAKQPTVTNCTATSDTTSSCTTY